MRRPLLALTRSLRPAHRRRRASRRLPGAGPAGALLLASLPLGACGRAQPPEANASPSPSPETPAAPVPPRPALPWLGRWTSAPGDGQVGFDLRADGTAQAFVLKGWDRPQPVTGQWATNPDGRSASLVMNGGGFSPLTLIPGPAGLLARADFGAVALSACPGGRWPWQDVDFGRRELLDAQRADLESITSLLYKTAEGIDLLNGNRRLAGQPTEGLAGGTLLSPEPILKAMRARLDALIREGKDPRWTEAARERLTGGRDRLGYSYEFYWSVEGAHYHEVLVGVAPETRAALRPVEPAWRATHQSVFTGMDGDDGGPWFHFVRPGSKEVAAGAPPAAAPASPAAVPFGPGADAMPAERRVEVVTLIEAGLTERANPPVPVGDFEVFTGREGWLVRNDPARRRYNGSFLELFQRLAVQNLLTLTGREPAASGGAAGAGTPAPAITKAYRLTPSERLRQLADPTRSVPGQALAVPLIGFAVLTVDEVRPWSEPGRAADPGSALLVSGTYRRLPSALYLLARPDYQRQDLRFRALLRPGPGGAYPFTLTALDYGVVGQEGWLTHELP